MSEVTVSNNSINAVTTTNESLNTSGLTFDTQEGTFGDHTDIANSPRKGITNDSINAVTVQNETI